MKYSKRFEVKDFTYAIPVSRFRNREFSTFEIIVSYLKDKVKLSNHQIAVILKRDDRTIWTVYNRAIKKKNG